MSKTISINTYSFPNCAEEQQCFERTEQQYFCSWIWIRVTKVTSKWKKSLCLGVVFTGLSWNRVRRGVGFPAAQLLDWKPQIEGFISVKTHYHFIPLHFYSSSSMKRLGWMSETWQKTANTLISSNKVLADTAAVRHAVEDWTNVNFCHR